jgi:sulfhydrogenase subunit gamma (sulfur reductase)
MPETDTRLDLRRLRAAGIERHTAKAWLFRFEPAPGSGLEHFEFVPGQVVVISKPSAIVRYENLIAIASPPSAQGAIEFLVKREGSACDWLFDLDVGDEVEVAGPIGGGFPVDAFWGKDLLFVAIGTAIAPIRSAILHAVEQRAEFGRMAVVYGARSPEDFAFADEYDAWRSADVKLELTVTQPGETWTGATGRVQDLLGDAVRHMLEPVAFVCGSDEMMDECEAALVASGVPRAHVHRNY